MAYVVYSYHKFGDHCITYGILREFAKHHEHIQYYCDEKDANTCQTNKRLFASLKNVEMMEETYYKPKHHADFHIANTGVWFAAVDPWDKNPRLPTPDWFTRDWIFDRQWYYNADVPYYKKWDNFYFERDSKKEKEVYYDIFGLKDKQEFIFTQQDISRQFLIDKKYIDDRYKVIEFSAYPEANVLDVLYTVEKAKEVHTYNTGLRSFIDLMNIKHDNLYYHRYARNGSAFEQVGMRLNWKKITK
jgi:hypothetical protein